MKIIPYLFSCFYGLLLLFLSSHKTAYSISWKSPQVLFSHSTQEGESPLVKVHPTLDKAIAVWIGQQEIDSHIYSTDFQGNSWEGSSWISSLAKHSHLKMSMDRKGDLLAVWDTLLEGRHQLELTQNQGEGWLDPITIQKGDIQEEDPFLQIVSSEEGVFVISWLSSEKRLQAMTLQERTLSLPYFLSKEGTAVISAAFISGKALFTSAKALYMTSFDPLSPSPQIKILFPGEVYPDSLCLSVDKMGRKEAALFEDKKNHFFLSVTHLNIKPIYTVIEPFAALILQASIAISPKGDQIAAIWRTEEGKIRAGIFEGKKWKYLTTLSTQGASPQIAYDPTTNYVVAIWADFTAGDTRSKIVSSEWIESSWTSPTALSSEGSWVGEPQMDINAKGQACAIWARRETEGEQAKIEAVTNF